MNVFISIGLSMEYFMKLSFAGFACLIAVNMSGAAESNALNDVDQAIATMAHSLVTSDGFTHEGLQHLKLTVNNLLAKRPESRDLIISKLALMKEKVEESALTSCDRAYCLDVNRMPSLGDLQAFMTSLGQSSDDITDPIITPGVVSTPARIPTLVLPVANENPCTQVLPSQSQGFLPTDHQTKTCPIHPSCVKVTSTVNPVLSVSPMPTVTEGSDVFLDWPSANDRTPTPFSNISDQAESQETSPHDYGVAHLQGYRPTMEDTHAHAISPDGRFEFWGVYDGHAGIETADALAEGSKNCPDLISFHQFVFKNLERSTQIPVTDSDIAGSLKAAVKEYDDKLRERRWHLKRSGSTAIVALMDNATSTLFFINLGDARALVCTDQGQMAPLLRYEWGQFVKTYNATEDHKPDTDKEAIQAAGSIVEFSRIGGQFGLGVSRAFGDFGYKNNPGMIKHMTNADIYMIKNPHECSVILACDGLWDINIDGVSNQEIINKIVDLKINQAKKAEQVAKDLISFALQKGSLDNITSCVIYF